ncbi:inactive pancreatic lipase-related protein 1-like [Nerophis lumbriciformis]|uniref:inactive pancreatic lipase-related protein 1-like n=1 Tax=Nerophis lumbriciformis TaxID=546530 RepID=UPI002ADF01C4|nr:inactive pancreatic lipase-related protein 1-like [Nerophis lumbriciformis]
MPNLTMSPMKYLVVLCLLAGASYAAEVCLGELGCFNDLPPWGGTSQRPASVLPWHADQMGTRFLLFTPRNRYFQEIKIDETIHASNYAGTRKTRIIIPGYLQNGEEDWPQELCKDMLKWENINCIAVEWKKGIKCQYAQAANNGRVVAAQVASMLTFLMGNYKQTAEKFYVIGHSLGAHIAGEVGSRISGLARITGLDPIEPYFSDTNATVRLDTTDATFVDVIHTDGFPFNTKLGLGMGQPIGHIDFYPNGGEVMPGCKTNKGTARDLDAIWEGTKPYDACNHVRAYQYYMESVLKSQGFVGFPCSDADTFAAGKCFPCAQDKCPLMGRNADRIAVTNISSKTKYFLTTGSSAPFGRYSYSVKVTLDGPSWSNPGFMYVSLVGDEDCTKDFQLHVGTMKPGRTYEVVVHAEVDVGDVSEVRFYWNNHIFNPLNPKYGASKVELLRAKDKKITHFCGKENVAENVIQAVLLCQPEQAQ